MIQCEYCDQMVDEIVETTCPHCGAPLSQTAIQTAARQRKQDQVFNSITESGAISSGANTFVNSAAKSAGSLLGSALIGATMSALTGGMVHSKPQARHDHRRPAPPSHNNGKLPKPPFHF